MAKDYETQGVYVLIPVETMDMIRMLLERTTEDPITRLAQIWTELFPDKDKDSSKINNQGGQ